MVAECTYWHYQILGLDFASLQARVLSLRNTIEFYLYVFTEFAENICHYSKRAWTCHSATSCVIPWDATTAPARHMLYTGSLNWAQIILHWFIRFPEFAEFSEFLFHLGKTPMARFLFVLQPQVFSLTVVLYSVPVTPVAPARPVDPVHLV